MYFDNEILFLLLPDNESHYKNLCLGTISVNDSDSYFSLLSTSRQRMMMMMMMMMMMKQKDLFGYLGIPWICLLESLLSLSLAPLQPKDRRQKMKNGKRERWPPSPQGGLLAEGDIPVVFLNELNSSSRTSIIIR
jgi:hypothetical protein